MLAALGARISRARRRRSSPPCRTLSPEHLADPRHFDFAQLRSRGTAMTDPEEQALPRVELRHRRGGVTLRDA